MCNGISIAEKGVGIEIHASSVLLQKGHSRLAYFFCTPLYAHPNSDHSCYLGNKKKAIPAAMSLLIFLLFALTLLCPVPFEAFQEIWDVVVHWAGGWWAAAGMAATGAFNV